MLLGDQQGLAPRRSSCTLRPSIREEAARWQLIGQLYPGGRV
jgi:hypothetical protein